MAPPLLSKRDPHTGELQKREFGPWMLTAFRMLAPLRRLRGTALDVFGYTAERRQERRDIVDYLAMLDDLLPRVPTVDYQVVRELLALPLQLRGFGHVKDRNREQLRARERQLRQRLDGDSSVVKIVDAA